jgi:hypothetical protein
MKRNEDIDDFFYVSQVFRPIRETKNAINNRIFTYPAILLIKTLRLLLLSFGSLCYNIEELF